jgi:hypothetical protein
MERAELWARGVVAFDDHVTVYSQLGGLISFDVSDPAMPIEVARLPSADEAPGDIAHQDGYLYVAHGDLGLSIVDVSVPAEMAYVGSLVLSETWVYEVAVDNDLAIVLTKVGVDEGAALIDVSDPEAPEVVGTLDFYKVVDVALDEGTAFFASDFYGIDVVDVSDPENPAVLTRIETPGYVRSVAVVGERLWVAQSEPHPAQVFDVSDPMRPKLVGSAPSMDNATKIAVGEAGVVVSDLAGFRLYSSDPCDVAPRNPDGRAGS